MFSKIFIASLFVTGTLAANVKYYDPDIRTYKDFPRLMSGEFPNDRLVEKEAPEADLPQILFNKFGVVSDKADAFIGALKTAGFDANGQNFDPQAQKDDMKAILVQYYKDEVEWTVRAEKSKLTEEMATTERELSVTKEDFEDEQKHTEDNKEQKERMKFLTSVLNDPEKELTRVTKKRANTIQKSKTLRAKLLLKNKRDVSDEEKSQVMDLQLEQGTLTKCQETAQQLINSRASLKINEGANRLKATLPGLNHEVQKAVQDMLVRKQAEKLLKQHEKQIRPSVMSRLFSWN